MKAFLFRDIEKAEKEIEIRNPYLINPFLAYAFFWLLAILLYHLSPSRLNQPLHIGLWIFLLSTVAISIGLALFFNKKLYKKKLLIHYMRPPLFILPLLILSYIAEFIYSGTVPLFQPFFHENPVSYLDFGIPTLHVLIVTFSSFYCLYSFFMFIHFRKWISFLSCLTPALYFALIYSRGMLLFILVSLILLFLVDKHIKIWHLAAVALLGIFAMWLFGILGNIRSGYEWNDTLYLMHIAEIDGDRYSLLAPFYWVEEYIICSLRNLNYNFGSFDVLNIQELLYSVIPDFFAKRLFPSVDFANQVTLPSEALITGTAYIQSYIACGVVGMCLLFIIFMLIPFLISLIKRLPDETKLLCFVMLFYLLGMTIFDNIIMYSGYSFAIVMALAFAFFLWGYERLYKRLYKKLFPPSRESESKS